MIRISKSHLLQEIIFPSCDSLTFFLFDIDNFRFVWLNAETMQDLYLCRIVPILLTVCRISPKMGQLLKKGNILEE